MLLGPYTTGEKPGAVTITFTDSAGAALNLTGYAARLVYRLETSATASATIVILADANASGQVTFTPPIPTSGDGGVYVGEAWAGNGTTRLASEPLKWTVRPAAGPIPSI